MSDHYRVVISLVHVQGPTDETQPELYSCSLPGFRSLERAKDFLLKLLKIAHIIQNVHCQVDRLEHDLRRI